MFEGFRTFSDYVKEYELQRTEGLLLRHLNSVFRVLAQTVPESAKTEEVQEMETYLGAMVRQVDSSLLEEWERLKNPSFQAEATDELRPPGAEEAARDITRDEKSFLALVRTRIFSFLRLWSLEENEEALEMLAPLPETDHWTIFTLRERWETFRADHGTLRLDAEGRNVRHTQVSKAAGTWDAGTGAEGFRRARRLDGDIFRRLGRLPRAGRGGGLAGDRTGDLSGPIHQPAASPSTSSGQAFGECGPRWFRTGRAGSAIPTGNPRWRRISSRVRNRIRLRRRSRTRTRNRPASPGWTRRRR
jgi:hypothetical protein